MPVAGFLCSLFCPPPIFYVGTLLSYVLSPLDMYSFHLASAAEVLKSSSSQLPGKAGGNGSQLRTLFWLFQEEEIRDK